MDSALGLRSAASDTQLHLRDFLAPSLSRVTQEHALYKLLMLSNSLSALEAFGKACSRLNDIWLEALVARWM